MDQDGKIVEWNPALERLTHYTEKEIKEKGLECMMPPEIAARHKMAVDKVMSSDILKGRVAVVNCTIVPHGPDEKPLPVRISVRTVQDKKGRRFAIAHIDEKNIIRDFTMH